MSEEQEQTEQTEQKSEIQTLREEYDKKFAELKGMFEQEKEEMTKQLETKDAAIADLKVQVGEQKESITKYQKELVRQTEGEPAAYQDYIAPWDAAYDKAVKRIFADMNFRDDKAREQAQKLINMYKPW